MSITGLTKHTDATGELTKVQSQEDIRGRNLMIAGAVVGGIGLAVTLAVAAFAMAILFVPVMLPAMAFLGSMGVAVLAILPIGVAGVTASVALPLLVAGFIYRKTI